MASTVLRNLVRLTLALFGMVLALGMNAVLATANFLGTKVSFVLLGYDAQPLRYDPLLGQTLGAFFPEATIADLLAFAVAAGVTGGFFAIGRLLNNVFEILQDLRIHLEHEKEKEAARGLLAKELVLLMCFAVPVVYAAYWDYLLFQFRAIAGANLIEHPEQAVQLLGSAYVNSDVLAFSLSHAGGYGYLAITAIGVLLLELSISRTSTYASRLLVILDGWWEDPVEDAKTDERQRTEAPQNQQLGGQSKQNTRQREDLGKASFPDAAAAHTSRERASEVPQRSPTSAHRTTEARTTTTARESPRHEADHSSPEANGAHGPLEGLAEVIAEQPGARVTVQDALREPERYVVDAERHQVWDRDYYEAVFGST